MHPDWEKEAIVKVDLDFESLDDDVKEDLAGRGIIILRNAVITTNLSQEYFHKIKVCE